MGEENCRKTAWQIPTREEMRRTLAQRHGEQVQKRLESAAAAVCGLGGLGSNIAVALARAGVGRLILIDFDRVDAGNLHRQQYAVSQIGRYKTEAMQENLRAIAPYTETEIHTVRVTEDNAAGLLKGADVVCEAFDRAEEKALLVNTVLEKLPDVYLIASSGMAGFGPANAVRTRKITGRFYLCGDESSDVEECPGLLASRVMLCAAHQAHAALQLLTGQGSVV